MNRHWICSDVWMDILPSFDHAQLGLKMALLSDRFDILVDTHFDGKTTELAICREIKIRKDIGPKPKLSVWVDGTFVGFQLPDNPLPNKIRFIKDLQIDYIDHSVLTFLRSNKQIWDRMGTNLGLSIWSNKTEDNHRIWDIFTTELWPIFATSIRHLGFDDCTHLDKLRRLISPTILTDLDQLNSIDSDHLCPDGIADDGPNATAGQALAKWLHNPSKDGQPNELRCCVEYFYQAKWINNFKETFRRATTSVAYNVRLKIVVTSKMNIVKQFELMNEVTQEKLTLTKDEDIYWLLKRCPIIVGETATNQWEKDENLDNLNGVIFRLYHDCIGPLSPPDQSDEKMFSLPGPSDQRNKKK